MAAVQENGSALQYASKGLKVLDKEVVLAAVQQNGYALQYASEGLKRDREIVLAAVQQNGWALQFAGDELKGNEDIVAAAINTEFRAHYHAHDDTERKLFLGMDVDTFINAFRNKKAMQKIRSLVMDKEPALVLLKFVKALNDDEFKKYLNYIEHSSSLASKSVKWVEDLTPNTCQILMQHHLVTYKRKEKIGVVEFENHHDIFILDHMPDMSFKGVTMTAHDAFVLGGIIKPELEENRMLSKVDLDAHGDPFSMLKKIGFPFEFLPVEPPRDVVEHIKGVNPRNYIIIFGEVVGYCELEYQYRVTCYYYKDDSFELVFNDAEVEKLMEPYMNDIETAVRLLKHMVEFTELNELLEVKNDVNGIVVHLVNILMVYRDAAKNILSRNYGQKIGQSFILKKLASDNLTCQERSLIFKAMMEYAGFGADFAVAQNAIHAFIIHRDGYGIELGGIPLAFTTRPPKVNESSHVPIHAVRQHASKTASGGDGMASMLHSLDTRESKIPAFMNASSGRVMLGSFMEKQIMDIYKGQHSKELPEVLPEKVKLTADSSFAWHHALTNRYPDRIIVSVLQNGLELASKRLEDILESVNDPILVFDLRGNSLPRDYQSACKQAFDNEKRAFRGVELPGTTSVIALVDDDSILLPSFDSRLALAMNVALPSLDMNVPVVYNMEEGYELIGKNLADALITVKVEKIEGKNHQFSVSREQIPTGILGSLNIQVSDPISDLLQKAVDLFNLGDKWLIEYICGVELPEIIGISVKQTQNATENFPALLPVPLSRDGPTEFVALYVESKEDQMEIEESEIGKRSREEDAGEGSRAKKGKSLNGVAAQERRMYYYIDDLSNIYEEMATLIETDIYEIKRRKTPWLLSMEDDLLNNRTVEVITNESGIQRKLWEYFKNFRQSIFINGGQPLSQMPASGYPLSNIGLGIPDDRIVQVVVPNRPGVYLDEQLDGWVDISKVESLKQWLENGKELGKECIIESQHLENDEIELLKYLSNPHGEDVHLVIHGSIYRPTTKLTIVMQLNDKRLTGGRILQIAPRGDWPAHYSLAEIKIAEELKGTFGWNLTEIDKLFLSPGQRELQTLYSSAIDEDLIRATHVDDYCPIRPEVIQAITTLKRIAMNDSNQNYGVSLVGAPGSGKTKMAERLAELWGLEVHVFDSQPKEYEEAQLLHLYKNGGTAVINEFEFPEWEMLFRKFKLENRNRHPNFFVIASQNNLIESCSQGGGLERGFFPVIKMGQLDKDEKKMIAMHLLNDEEAGYFLEAFNESEESTAEFISNVAESGREVGSIISALKQRLWDRITVEYFHEM